MIHLFVRLLLRNIPKFIIYTLIFTMEKILEPIPFVKTLAFFFLFFSYLRFPFQHFKL